MNSYAISVENPRDSIWRVTAVGEGRLGIIRCANDRFEYRSGNGNEGPWHPVEGGIACAIGAVVAAAPDVFFTPPELSDDQIVLQIPGLHRKGRLQGHQARSIVQGTETLDYAVEELAGLTWEGIHILDYGCGTKFAQALHQYHRPFAKYWGIDIDEEMIEVLRRTVSDERYQFECVDFANELYNNSPRRMTDESVLPIPTGVADLITMQSVLTHMAPQDFENCLKMLRPYLRPGGAIFFTLIASPVQKEDYRELRPDRPLLRASYREDYAISLIEKAGFRIDHYVRRQTHPYLPEHVLIRSA